MTGASTPKRVMIVGPPQFWPAAFAEVRRRGDRVVQLALPSTIVEPPEQLRGVIELMEADGIDELLLDLTPHR